MLKYIAYSIFPLGLLSFSATANYGLSIDGMNANLERCFKQTQLIEQGIPADKLSTRYCSRVINNTWHSREMESGALVNRGLIYQYKGNSDRALKDFVRAAAINPKSYQAHIAAAQLLFDKQEFGDALVHYDHAIEIDNQNPSLIRNRRLTALSLEKEQAQQLTMQQGKPDADKSLQ